MRGFHSGVIQMSAALAGLWACTTESAAQNWPSFRGPNASGIAEGSPLPVKCNVTPVEDDTVHRWLLY